MPTREATLLNRAVAAQIRSVLTIRQIRQAALAKQMGVTEVWLSRRLREVQPLSLDDVEAICRALKVEPTEMIAAAVEGARWLTQGYSDAPVRPRDSRPAGGPARSKTSGPPNVAQGIRRSRVTGVPLAVANAAQDA
jgi:DNA-binding Xre family transcriptional regulator